jgi:4-amino-4-deoxy-L-arabinose transferase-like glycosyltransferase
MRDRVAAVLIAILEHRYFVPACLAVYLGLRLALVLWVPVEPHSDEQWYFNQAVGIAAGRGYSENHVPTAYWPVGWPGFLGIVFRLTYPSPFVGEMVNWLCSAAIFVLTLRLGTRLFGEPLVGRLAALFLTVCPNQIAYVPILGTEVFYSALLLLALDILLAGGGLWRLAAAGVVFGIAALTKAQTVLLPAFLFTLWWLVSLRRGILLSNLAKAAVVYAAMAVVILPWTVRNYDVFGHFVLISTNGGLTLLGGNNPSANGDDTETDPLLKRVPHDVADQVAADHLATSLALAWMRQHPAAAISLVPKKIWRLWAPDGEAEWAYQAGYSGYDRYWRVFRAVRIVNQAYYLGLMLLFVASIGLCIRDRRLPAPEFATGYALVLFTTAISMIFSGQSRFHFPMMPWIATYAAWTILRLLPAPEPGARNLAVSPGAARR